MKWFKSKEQPRVRNPKYAQEELSFRRSRTLTGSASSEVTTVAESRTHLKSPRLKEHELRKHRKLLAGGLLGVIAIIASGIWLLEQYVIDVSLASNASRTVSLAPYDKTIQEYLNSRPFERFRFALNQEQLSDFVRQKHTEVSSVTINGDSGLVASSGSIVFRKPVASWQVNSQKYYVDETGETFQANSFSEPGVIVKDESGINVNDLQFVASSRLLRFIGQIVGGINTAGKGQVTQVTIPSGTLRQLNVTLAGHNYPIKTHMDRQPAGQVADIIAAVGYLDSKGITPEYIDARVTGRAYYR